MKWEVRSGLREFHRSPFFAHKQSQKSTEAELVSCGITDFAVYYRQILVTGEGRDHICLTISLR